MSFHDIYKQYADYDFEGAFSQISENRFIQSSNTDTPGPEDLIALLSQSANKFLETSAQKANQLTLRHFGKTIQLYTPLYLSNYCDNKCVYCGFNAGVNTDRKKLDTEEVDREAKAIALSGLKHILLLTGGSRRESPPEYITECVSIVKKYFNSISVEIYALSEKEYGGLVKFGVDGLTIYQETYDETLYKKVHLAGPKQDFLFRLEAPERAGRQAMRTINIGSLLGLGDWKKEAFFTGLHAKYLQDSFPEAEISVSVPRMRPHFGDDNEIRLVSDREVVRIITALRIFLPRVGITLSTREDPAFRENLLPLGITKMSAGSTTTVGGHTVHYPEAERPEQFEISDKRNVREIMELIREKGYQPVLKDWIGGSGY